jgi:hypothetical protein
MQSRIDKIKQKFKLSRTTKIQQLLDSPNKVSKSVVKSYMKESSDNDSFQGMVSDDSDSDARGPKMAQVARALLKKEKPASKSFKPPKIPKNYLQQKRTRLAGFLEKMEEKKAVIERSAGMETAEGGAGKRPSAKKKIRPKKLSPVRSSQGKKHAEFGEIDINKPR